MYPTIKFKLTKVQIIALLDIIPQIINNSELGILEELIIKRWALQLEKKLITGAPKYSIKMDEVLMYAFLLFFQDNAILMVCHLERVIVNTIAEQIYKIVKKPVNV